MTKLVKKEKFEETNTKSMKRIKETKIIKNQNQIVNALLAFSICMTLPTICFAAGGGDFFDNFIDLFFGWVQKAGLLVGAFGGIKLGLGIHSQTEEEKIQGLKTLIAGAIVFAIGSAPGMFGL